MNLQHQRSTSPRIARAFYKHFSKCCALALLGLSINSLGCNDSPPTASLGDPMFDISTADAASMSPAGRSIQSHPVSYRSTDQAAPSVHSGDSPTLGESRFQWRLKRLERALQRPKTEPESQKFVTVVDDSVVNKGSQQNRESGETELVLPMESLALPANEVQLVATPADETTDDLPPELAPDRYKTWDVPDVAIFVTGQQNGYIEPCGCTGLDKQKGGIARRATFMSQLKEAGWDLVPMDVGNQVRRLGQQAVIKLHSSDKALKAMKYQSVGLGPLDLRLAATDLLVVAAAEDPETAMYHSANVVLIDSSLMPTSKVVVRGKHKIGLANIFDSKSLEGPLSPDITISKPVDAAKKVLAELKATGANFLVCTYYGKEEAAAQVMRDVPGFDLIVVGGGYGEPLYKPQDIEGSKCKMIVPGNKGMYVGLVGLYDGKPFNYARVPLTHTFGDDKSMRQLMGEYQEQLKQVGLENLGLRPVPHPSGQKFIGSKSCEKCHDDEYAVWENSPHAEATNSIVSPPEDRGDVPRHFDPECLSCHVTGWSPQDYYPYESGFLDLESGRHLHGNGCENCHGPGKEHAAAEEDNSGVPEAMKLKLRKSMQLPLSRAKDHCMKCHDLDNSPDFHEEDAFEDDYWPTIEH